MISLLHELRFEEAGQDVAEYAVMMAVVLIVVIGTVRLVSGKQRHLQRVRGRWGRQHGWHWPRRVCFLRPPKVQIRGHAQNYQQTDSHQYAFHASYLW